MDKNGKIDKQYPVFMTIDVEEYYHILGVKGTPPIHEWDSLESRVELGMQKCFDLLERMNTRATLFFLGYIAAKHSRLVRRAVDLGHEIASHGMYHQEIDHLSKSAFYKDASDSRKLLEDISGREVRGWRSPGFSSNMSTPWFFDVLVKTGYKYDSSIMPMKKSIQGVNHLMRDPRFIHVQSGKIFEYPISVVEFGFLRVCMFGGGYLRLFPQFLISLMKDRVLDKHSLTIYIHPREMDPEHPQIDMNLYRKFKCYVNMGSVQSKLEMLLYDKENMTLGDYYDSLEDK